MVYPKENVGVGLARNRFGSDKGALQQRETGCFSFRDDEYCPGAGGLDAGDKDPPIEGRGKQKPK